MKDYEGAGIKSGIYHGTRVYPALCECSVVSYSATTRTEAHLAPVSTGFARQE